MKIIKNEKNEEFASSRKKDVHFYRHVNDNKSGEFKTDEYKSPERYEEGADKLAAEPVRTSDLNSKDDVVGFIENYKYDNIAYVKYRKSTKEMVIYIPSSKAKSGNIIYSFYKADDNKYNTLFDKYYRDEINV